MPSLQLPKQLFAVISIHVQSFTAGTYKHDVLIVNGLRLADVLSRAQAATVSKMDVAETATSM